MVQIYELHFRRCCSICSVVCAIGRLLGMTNFYAHFLHLSIDLFFASIQNSV